MRTRALFSRLAALLLIGLALFAGRPAGAEAPEAAAKAVIEEFYGALLQAMNDGEKLGYQGRFALLEPAIGKAYDMDRMARRVLGPNLAEITRSEFARMRDVFMRLSVATYASRFKKHNGEQLLVDRAQVAQNIGVLVESRIVTSKGESIGINYLMTNETGAWRINDVFLKGTISEVATRRSEYSAVLRQQGIEGLINSIQARITEIEAEK